MIWIYKTWRSGFNLANFFVYACMASTELAALLTTLRAFRELLLKTKDPQLRAFAIQFLEYAQKIEFATLSKAIRKAKPAVRDIATNRLTTLLNGVKSKL